MLCIEFKIGFNLIERISHDWRLIGALLCSYLRISRHLSVDWLPSIKTWFGTWTEKLFPLSFIVWFWKRKFSVQSNTHTHAHTRILLLCVFLLLFIIKSHIHFFPLCIFALFSSSFWISSAVNQINSPQCNAPDIC